MDWLAVARILAERTAPTAILDRDRRIRMLNPALEDLLGVSRDTLEGRPVDETCLAPCSVSPSADTLACRVFAPDGRRLDLGVHGLRVGDGPASSILLVVRTAYEPSAPNEQADGGDVVEYEIGGTVTDFGRLSAIRKTEGVQRFWTDDAPRCHLAVHGAGTPCAWCPVPLLGRRGERTAVACAPSEDGGAQRIATAERSGAIVRVRLERLPRAALDAVLCSMVDDLAAGARLSVTEHAVLEHVLTGRSTPAIAELLAIDERAVRLVQTAAVQKLGAAARSDLLRARR